MKASKRILSLVMTVLMIMGSASMIFAYAETAASGETAETQVTTPIAYAKAKDGDKLWDVDFTSSKFVEDSTLINYSYNYLVDSDGATDKRQIAGARTATSLILDNNNTKYNGKDKNGKDTASAGYQKAYGGHFSDYALEGNTYTVEFAMKRSDYRRMGFYYWVGYSNMNQNLTARTDAYGAGKGTLTGMVTSTGYKTNSTTFGNKWLYINYFSEKNAVWGSNTFGNVAKVGTDNDYVYIKYVIVGGQDATSNVLTPVQVAVYEKNLSGDYVFLGKDVGVSSNKYLYIGMGGYCDFDKATGSMELKDMKIYKGDTMGAFTHISTDAKDGDVLWTLDGSGWSSLSKDNGYYWRNHSGDVSTDTSKAAITKVNASKAITWTDGKMIVDHSRLAATTNDSSTAGDETKPQAGAMRFSTNIPFGSGWDKGIYTLEMSVNSNTRVALHVSEVNNNQFGFALNGNAKSNINSTAKPIAYAGNWYNADATSATFGVFNNINFKKYTRVNTTNANVRVVFNYEQDKITLFELVTVGTSQEWKAISQYDLSGIIYAPYGLMFGAYHWDAKTYTEFANVRLVKGAYANTCTHADTDNDCVCDACSATICTDGNNDHKCDTCADVLSYCVDANADGNCDVCAQAFAHDHADANTDHKCDKCGVVQGEHKVSAGKHICDYCSGPVGGTVVDFTRDTKTEVQYITSDSVSATIQKFENGEIKVSKKNAGIVCAGVELKDYKVKGNIYEIYYWIEATSDVLASTRPCFQFITDSQGRLGWATIYGTDKTQVYVNGTFQAKASSKPLKKDTTVTLQRYFEADNANRQFFKVTVDGISNKLTLYTMTAKGTYTKVDELTMKPSSSTYLAPRIAIYDAVTTGYVSVGGVTIVELDDNKDHKCDICGTDACTDCGVTGFGTCADSETDKDHVCDYGCGKVFSECIDADTNHACDVCKAAMGGDCADKAGDGDHKCDYCGKDDITECIDKNTDHACDDCGAAMGGDCADKAGDDDHKCDYCGKDGITECIDKNTDHACDECGAAMGGDCADKAGDGDHQCDYCGKDGVNECVDVNTDADHKCDECGKDNVTAHVDSNKDHKCDNGCDKVFGTCEDKDLDHKCDYGCDKVFGDCVDKDLDHDCDYGCDKVFGECEDTDLDHKCDYGCDKVFGTCEDKDLDHKCDYGCDKVFGDCVDKDLDHDCDYGCDKYFGKHADKNLDHNCDYGCKVAIGDCVDKDLDHKCDYGCDKVFGECEDKDHDHKCDYGCDKFFGECADSARDTDHVCDYGCGKVLEACVDKDLDHKCDNGCDKVFGACVDKNHDHKCDYGCFKYFGEHKDSSDDKDHVCDYGCGAVLEHCYDKSGDGDHACDACGIDGINDCTDARPKDGICDECGVALDHAHVDVNKDHKCDNGCAKSIGTHDDKNKDHKCDYGCRETIGECVDANKDHKCDYGCDKNFGAHKDGDKDHKCDWCGEALSICIDINKNHACDLCGATIGVHKAASGSHNCGYCGVPMSKCGDENEDGKCDVCGKALGSVENDTVIGDIDGIVDDTVNAAAEAAKKAAELAAKLATARAMEVVESIIDSTADARQDLEETVVGGMQNIVDRVESIVDGVTGGIVNVRDQIIAEVESALGKLSSIFKKTA